jgi:putative transferase (TIGR04331 family)
LLRNSWVRQGISKIMQVLSVILARRQSTIFLINSYFSKKIELRLLVRSFGKVFANWRKPMPSLTFEYDSEKRNILRSAPLGCSEFERCLSTMLHADMPQCFVEGFSSLKNSAIKRFPRHSSAIFSATGWYYDEAFKHWAAESAQFGTLLLGTQHGGNYGALDRMANEAHETSIVDIYYSWGWERKDCYAKVVPMPATKLLERNEIGADSRKNNILWVATHAPRYSVGLPRIPGHFSEYLSWQIRFAKALPMSITEVVCFRTHQEEYSWGISRRLKDCIPEIRFDPCSVPFQNSLSNCRLYVCDHLSTTFIEALAVNKPTILFWNPVDNELRPEAKVYFDLLVDCGVLFDTPEAAATAVTVAYDDVVTWWNESRRQEAVRKFRDRFARTSPNGVMTWYGELTKSINLSSPL